MKFRTIGLLGSLLFSVMTGAAELRQDAPTEYVVKKGDTLWSISELFLKSPWQWPELWRTNQHIDNPHLIYPGDLLRLTFDDEGQPQLVVVKSETKPSFKLTPAGDKQLKDKSAVPLLSWEQIRQYVDKYWILDSSELESFPQVLGDHDTSTRFASGDLLLVQNHTSDSPNVVVRERDHIVNNAGESLGTFISIIADTEALDTADGMDLTKLRGTSREVKQGDRLVPASLFTTAGDMQLQAASGQKGTILRSTRDASLIGPKDVVIIDLGDTQVSPGTVFGIYKEGPAVDTDAPAKYAQNDTSDEFAGDIVSAPALKVGELVVFKSFAKTSFAFVTDAKHILKRGAIIAAP